MQLSRSTSPSPPVPLLLGAQTAFNIGFYAVVPFIALILAQNFAVGATAVGIILGLRTCAQQGMFLLGGAFADHFGARAILLVGIVIRVLGFLALGAGTYLAPSAPGAGLSIFIAGTVLTGLGGALFSPALNLYIARADQLLLAQQEGSLTQRTTLFAWLNVTGEMGAVLGPLVGYALMGWGFTTVATGGALGFAALWLLFWLVLPADHLPQRSAAGSALTQSSEILISLAATVKDKPFTRFALFHAVDLFCYNQLYFALPLVAASVAYDSNRVLANAFAAVSILILLGQVPISRLVSRFQVVNVVRAGYTISALGLIVCALAQNKGSFLLTVAGALLIGAGHLTSSPQALSYVSRSAPPASQAAYLGFLATCGGFAVLLGNLLLGALFDLVSQHQPGYEWAIWVFTAAGVLTAAVLQKPLPQDSPRQVADQKT